MTCKCGEFSDFFDELQGEVHRNAKEKGFWEDINIGEKIALIHSELSEAVEAIRDGNPKSEKIPEYTCFEEELADAVIRIMDLAEFKQLHLSAAIEAKILYNRGRPYKHNKEF